MKNNKQGSSKVLVVLILAMHINESALLALNWYWGWLAYVKYSGSTDSLALFVTSEETPLIVLYTSAADNLLLTFKLGIADSIMVIRFGFCVSFNSS
jgi:hypothetical protein